MSQIQRLFTLPKELSDRVNEYCKENDDTFAHFTRMALRTALSGFKTKDEKALIEAEPLPEVPINVLPPLVETPSDIQEPVITPRCSAPKCINEAIGRFKLTTPDFDSKELYLCGFHLNIAKREGEVREV